MVCSIQAANWSRRCLCAIGRQPITRAGVTRYPSAMNDVFLHNPHCSKSRAALELVREAGAELPIREYLQDPLSFDELRRLAQILGVRPIAIARRSEPQFQALGLSDTTPEEDVLRALAEHPILVERPIVVRGDRAVVGRPPEKVRELL
jgi:arsenate reductase